MKSLGIFLAVLFLAVSGAVAQEHPAVAAQPNTVYVGADGKFEAAPDTAQIQFNVSVQDETSQVAFQRASKNVEQVRQGILHTLREPPGRARGSVPLDTAHRRQLPHRTAGELGV